jgi:hypothetical protein
MNPALVLAIAFGSFLAGCVFAVVIQWVGFRLREEEQYLDLHQRAMAWAEESGRAEAGRLRIVEKEGP